MRRLVPFVALALALAALVAPSPATAYPGAPWFEPDEPYDGNFPDPSVLYDAQSGQYYAYATTTGGAYLPAMHSGDAQTWIARGTYPEPGCVPGNDDPFYNDALPCPSPWAPDIRSGGRLAKDLWGPGVARIGNQFVLFYGIRVSTSSERFCIAVATSSNPLGPFFDVRNGPLHCDDRHPNGVIDPQPFVDPTTGTPYLIWKTEGIPGSEPTKFWSRQLTADGTSFAPGTGDHELLGTTNGSWEGNVIESPTMVRYGDRYLLFYSANEWTTADYATGVAFCNTPTGPCFKSPANPILRSQGDILGPGGPSAFVDASGALRLAHHYWRAPYVGYPSDPGCDGIDPQTHQPHCESQGQRRMRVTYVTVLSDRVTISTTPPPVVTARNIDSGCPQTLAPRPYTDVPSGSSSARAINCITAWGITTGSGTAQYNPTGLATREQMASFVARLIDATEVELPAASQDFFDDDNSSGHQDNINRLAAAGIVSGTGNRQYSPHANVTRAQMATFLFRAARFVLGHDLPPGQNWFADDTGSPHEHAINADAQAGIATGTGPGAFSPNNPVSRAQMASFLARLADLLVDEGRGITAARLADAYDCQVAYEVQTPIFEGPFDLLLHLILREQVDLYELRLSVIVDAYIVEMERLEQVDLDVATEFLLIAATLVELKAKRLLPGDDDIDLDEELALWEERDLLLARLLECKTFKDAAVAISVLAEEAGRSFPRRSGPEEHFVALTPDLLANTTPEQVRDAFLRAVAPKPVPRVELEHVAPIRASVTDAVEELLDELPRAGVLTFRRLAAGLVEKLDVVVRFLAVLELYKQGLVDLHQPRSIGELTITWVGGDVADSVDGAWMRSVAAVDAYDG